MSKSMLQSHPGEIANAIRRGRYEKSKSGILLRDSRVFIGGALRIRDDQDLDEVHAIDHNTLLLQGLTHALNCLLVPTGGYAPVTQWYVAPFSGDHTPANTETAATFPGLATEFTQYTAGTRLPLVFAAAATTPVAASDEAQLIFNPSGGPFNVYGAYVTSVAAKSSTGGKALAGIRLDNPRLAMANGDKLWFSYVAVASEAA